MTWNDFKHWAMTLFAEHPFKSTLLCLACFALGLILG